jgi:rhodanese-related sulfurtransferase
LNKKSLLTQILFILTAAVVFSFIANSINPNGIPLIPDNSKYAQDKSDSLKKAFLHQDSARISDSLKNNIKKQSDMIKPQNIKIDFAKILFDKNAVFIDGRTSAEYEQGHIKNALSIPYKEFSVKQPDEKNQVVKDLKKDQVIVCYCTGGDCEVSIDLAYELAKMGYTKLYIYLGGYKEWENSGYPVNK